MEHNDSKHMFRQLLKWKKRFVVSLGIATVLFIVATTILAVLYGLQRNITRVYRLVNDSADLCTTPYCIKTAHYLLESIDETIDPCENFYKFACGKWIRNARIPEDDGLLSTFSTLQTQVIYDIIDLLSTPSINETIELNSVQNIRNLYSSCVNESNIERDDIRGILSLIQNELGGWPILQQVKWNESTYSLMNVSVALSQYNEFTLFYILTYIDQKNSSIPSIYIGQGNLGLEDPSYYMNDTSITKSYRQFMRNVILTFDNHTSINNTDIDEIFNFEKSLAQSFWSKTQRSGLLFNRTTFSNLSMLMNTSRYFNFSEYLQRVYLFGNVTLVDTDIINISELKVLQNIAKILEQNSPHTIQNYFIWRFVMNHIDHMPKRFRSLKQEFRRVTKGSTVENPRSHTCASYINKNMGMIVSRLYIKKRFDETARQEAIDMIENIRLTFTEMINQAIWMEADSKSVAIEKARLITERIGYPNGLNGDNITELEEKYGKYKFNSSYIQNVLLMLQLNVKHSLHKLRESIDRKVWEYILPSDVNAYYRFTFNDITFTAAILQTPFFHKDAPKYLNYGGIGTVVGHELTHGFDNVGRQFDKNGNRLPWWTNNTINRFINLTKCMIDQYDNYSVAQISMGLNGKLTLGENIADNGGLKEAFYAYQKWSSMNKKIDKKLPGLTKYSAEQMFFLSFGSVWCSKLTDQMAKKYILIDPHSPTEFRVIGSTSNFAEFDHAFQCKPGQGNSRKNKCVTQHTHSLAMEKLYCILKPWANRYTVSLIWFLTIFNFYLCVKPLKEYAASIGFNGTPPILDTMTYYTPDEGYQTLFNLGDDGRRAYRQTNNAEFVFPVLLFVSLSLSNLSMGKGHRYIVGPFLYMIFEYVENLAERYVLEIYPNRHDAVMNLACYAGLVKFIFMSTSVLIVIVNCLIHFLCSSVQKQKLK
ncbi:unnamed protein product [Adineta ricciae]|uniref:Uncharacterized protein n=1 Tax=Adineta ricciae TaxID=249248 RepID=A0A815S5N4_ADIRI|nr:unnamed protein product [Adineta ricciae]